MWTTGMLKENAKSALKRFYWMGFLVCFVCAIVNGGIGSGSRVAFGNSGYTNNSSSKSGNFSYHDSFDFDHFYDERIAPIIGIIVGVTVGVLFIAMIFSLLYYSFVSGPATVGKCRFFMLARGFENVSFGKLFYSFQQGKYMSIVKTSFFKTLYITLWSLLFVIPGIIKKYQYYMVDYILCENPNIGYKRALELSKQMTDGEKWHIFVLELSFIGWNILSVITCCLGFYFLAPYVEATKAELYTVLRTKAFENGLTDVKELPGFTLGD